MKSVNVFFRQGHLSGEVPKKGTSKKMIIQNDTENDQVVSWTDNNIQNNSAKGDSEHAYEMDAQMIVHEIRNPLSAISFVNELLLKETEEEFPALHAFPEIIAKNVKRIEALLRELLQLNKAAENAFVTADICDIIEKSLQKADDRILLKKIKVIKSYGFDLMIKADSEKLAIAFLNIIINSIEALKEKGKLWITTYRAKDDIKVIFKDNGTGMSPDVANHMFEKGFSKNPVGNGIGLQVVRTILQEHGARIGVNSEKGTGTTIIISFKAD